MHNLGYPITEIAIQPKSQRRRISVSGINYYSACKKGSAGKSADELYGIPNFRARGLTVGSRNSDSCPSIGPYLRWSRRRWPLLRQWSHLNGLAVVLEKQTSSAIVGNREKRLTGYTGGLHGMACKVDSYQSIYKCAWQAVESCIASASHISYTLATD